MARPMPATYPLHLHGGDMRIPKKSPEFASSPLFAEVGIPQFGPQFRKSTYLKKLRNCDSGKSEKLSDLQLADWLKLRSAIAKKSPQK